MTTTTKRAPARTANTGCDLVADFKAGHGHRLPLVANKRTRWEK